MLCNGSPVSDVFLFDEKDGALADVRQREKCGEAQERYSARSRYGLLVFVDRSNNIKTGTDAGLII